LVSYFIGLSGSFTPIQIPDPELVSQLKEELPPALFESIRLSNRTYHCAAEFAEVGG
jgi:hypothetical protein